MKEDRVVGKMRDHQKCVEMSFMGKFKDHFEYMMHSHSIRGCPEDLQMPGRCSLKECQMMLDIILIGKVQSDNDARGSLFEK